MKRVWPALLLTLMGACAPSLGPDSMEMEVAKKPPVAEKERVTDNYTIRSLPSSSNSIEAISEGGIQRIIDTLRYSDLTHERAMDLGYLADAMRLRYDWKDDARKFPHLKGGKDDPTGKFIHVMANRHYEYEATSGLLEIVKNRTLFLELIHYFTSEPILSLKDYEILKNAIQEKKADLIEQMVDTIYTQFYSHFDCYYHTGSHWEPSKDPKEKGLLKPNCSGFQADQNGYFLGKTIYKPYLSGGVPIEDGIKIGRARINIVKLMTSLVLKYYDIGSQRIPLSEHLNP